MVNRILKMLTVICMSIGCFLNGINVKANTDRTKGIQITADSLIVTVSDEVELSAQTTYFLRLESEHFDSSLYFDKSDISADNGTITFAKNDLGGTYSSTSPVSVDLYRAYSDESGAYHEVKIETISENVVLPPLGTRPALSQTNYDSSSKTLSFTVPDGASFDGISLFLYSRSGTAQVLGSDRNRLLVDGNNISVKLSDADVYYGSEYVNGSYDIDLLLETYSQGVGPTAYYVGKFDINTAPPAPVMFGSISSGDGGKGRVFLITADPGMESVLTSGPYRFTLEGTRTDGSPVNLNFSNGLSDGAQPGTFVFDFNSTGQNVEEGFEATITSITIVPMRGGSDAQRYTIKTPQGGMYFHKFVDPVNEGSCTLVAPDSDPSQFSFKMTCVGGDGTDVVTDTNTFSDHSIYWMYLINPNTSQIVNQVMFVYGHVNGSFFSVGKNDINPQTSYITPDAYKLKLVVRLPGSSGQVDAYYGNIVDSTGNDTFRIGKVNDESPELEVSETTDRVTFSCKVDPTMSVSCNDYLKKMCDLEGTDGDPAYSQIRFTRYPMRGGKPFVSLYDYHEYDDQGNMIPNLVPNGDFAAGNVTSVSVSWNILKNIGIEKNTTDTYYDISFDVPGYARAETQYKFVNGLEPDDGAMPVMTQDEVTDENPKPAMVFSFPPDSKTAEEAEAYFRTITSITLTAMGQGSTNTIIFKPAKGGNAEVKDGKLIVDADAMEGVIGQNVTININSDTYARKTLNGQKVTCCIQIQPNDLTTRVVTDGIVVSTENEAYLKNLTKLEFHKKKSDKTKEQGDFEAEAVTYIDGSKKMLIPMTREKLEELNADTSVDNLYWSYAKADGYACYVNRVSMSMNPILFASDVNAAQSTWKEGGKPTEDSLQTIDDVATKLSNGYEVNAEDLAEKGDVAGLGIELIGAVGGAIATDNSTGNVTYEEIDSESKKVTVVREANTITGDVDTMISETGMDGAVKTDVQFDLTIKKDGDEIIQLPYGAMIRFNIPEGDAGTYYLLTQHTDSEGNVTYDKLDVTVEDGIGIAYTDQFSSFALVKDEKAPAPKPAPSDDSSKKSSSSGSAKKTSPVKSDNVVTCQMAGYPANYAWNESAKACQPGFIDTAGVFHGTAAVKKAGVPNTYDKGLMGNVWALMISVVTGIAAAYALKKY